MSISDNSKAIMGQTDPQHNGAVNWSQSSAACFRPEYIFLGYCHIPMNLLPTESVVSRTYSFIEGVCENANEVKNIIYVCVCVVCLVLCWALCKGHMFDRLLYLDLSRLHVADTDQNLPAAHLCVCVDGWVEQDKEGWCVTD